ncbi:adenosine receptor A3-like [Tubulanus polymorphus]|uniref:adenosine receptor A3-like n=1 Tax=Tubulanus polymorphus TaxID=672921 RepID=UPI003DA53876
MADNTSMNYSHILGMNKTELPQIPLLGMKDLNLTISSSIWKSMDLSISVVFGLFELILMIVIIVGNGMVILTAAKVNSIQKIASRLLVSLAMADLIIGGIMIPIHALSYIVPGYSKSKYLCIVTHCIITFAVGSSTLNLFAIAIERFVLINFPRHYHKLRKRNITHWVLLFVWIYSFVGGFLPLFGWNNWDDQRPPIFCSYQTVIARIHFYIVFSNMIFCYVMMTILYVQMFWSIKRRYRRTTPQPHNRSHRLSCISNIRRETKTTKLLAVVLCIFLLCWTPYLICASTSYFVHGKKYFKFSSRLFAVMGILNSAVNPFIYAWKSKEFKKRMMDLFCKTKS